MDVNDFDFELPENLIAQTPLLDRTASRLMILDPETGKVEHRHFRDLLGELEPGDMLVLNDTRVLPARLMGVKADTGAMIEVLLLKQTGDDEWETLVKPAKRIKIGTIVTFGDGLLKAECTGVLEQGGARSNLFMTGFFMKSWMNWDKCHYRLISLRRLMIRHVIRLYSQKNVVLQPRRLPVFILLMKSWKVFGIRASILHSSHYMLVLVHSVR